MTTKAVSDQGLAKLILVALRLGAYVFLTPVFFTEVLLVKFMLENFGILQSSENSFQSTTTAISWVNGGLIVATVSVSLVYLWRKYRNKDSTIAKDRFRLIKEHGLFLFAIAILALISSFVHNSPYNFVGIMSIIIAMFSLAFVVLFVVSMIINYVEKIGEFVITCYGEHLHLHEHYSANVFHSLLPYFQ